MNVIMFLADGFEEIEALCPLDLLRRAGVTVQTVGIGGKSITGAHGIAVLADLCDTDPFTADPDLVFLPGGMPGTLNLAASETVMAALRAAYARGAYLAAICAAPSLLGDLGYLVGKEATCYPGFEDRLVGATLSPRTVVVDGKIITAKGMGVATELGLTLVALLCGEEKAKELRHVVIAD